MKKIGKFLLIVFVFLAGAMFALFWFGDDDEDYDDGYGSSYTANNTSGQNSSGNGNSSQSTYTGTSSGTDYTATPMLYTSEAVREHQVVLKGNGEDTVTVLMYMNGSNLETDDQEATTDLSEMVAAGSSDKVNVLVQTMGTKKWAKKYGIASDRSQVYEVSGNGLKLVRDDLGQADCTVAKTLSEFITWGVTNYPADRYILMFWDHGGGPVYGFGYDEWNSDDEAALTTDEIKTALKASGVYFDFIGMDCCIMSCLEVTCSLYDYCDYMILSEDFESGLGWSYTGWLKQLYKNSSTSTPELAKIAIDDLVKANQSNTTDGDDSIMALIDQSMMKVLYKAWIDFAYANESTLLGNNYSRQMTRSKGGRISPALLKNGYVTQRSFLSNIFDDDSEEDVTLSDYYITDIMAVAKTIDSDESAALASAVSQALVYVNATSGDSNLTGLSVTLPYGDSSFYKQLKEVFTNCGFDDEYITWLNKFTSASGNSNYYDYDDWDDSWDGWDDYEDDYDWSDWSDFWDDDDYWDDDDDWGWNDWSYDNSWNSWFNDDDWDVDDYGHGQYHGDDYYYDDYGFGWDFWGW